MNPRLFTHLTAAQDELRDLTATWSMSEVPATVRNAILSIKAEVDQAMEPVDDAVAEGLLRDANRRTNCAECGSPVKWDGPHYECVGCGRHGGHGAGGGAIVMLSFDPLNLSGTMDADQLGEAETVEALRGARKRLAEVSNGHDHRSGQFDHGHAIRSREEPRMDGSDPFDGILPADVMDPHDPTES